MEDIDGRFDAHLNSNHTQAVVTIYPPHGDGKEVTLGEIVDRLRQMRVGHNLRVDAIRDGIQHARAVAMPMEVLAAQGVMPVDGQDAVIRHSLPKNLLRRYPPKHPRLSGATDWFSLDPAQIVKKGQELASITPLKLGVLGKTCTLPTHDVPYMPGKPPDGAIGDNVVLDPHGVRAYATEDGYFYLKEERLTVIPLHLFPNEIKGGEYALGKGAILYQGASDAQIIVEEFLAVRGNLKNCTLRVSGDVLIESAENCKIITPGDVFVEVGLENCDVMTRQKVVCCKEAQVVGGTLRAFGGVAAGRLGDPKGTETFVEVGNDYYTPLRAIEIERELATHQHNLHRIQATLKPLENTMLQDGLQQYRQMREQCQTLQHLELERIRLLKTEQHRCALFAKNHINATIEANEVFSGVKIRNGRSKLTVPALLQEVRFVEAMHGTVVHAVSLTKAS